MKTIITCEHGGNEIPKQYHYLFKDASQQLHSHEGLDIGALTIAKALAKRADFFFYTKISRLLVELNRSLHHPKLFSSFTKVLSQSEKESLLHHYYHPYRQQVTETIATEIAKGHEVLHISVHSFTPFFNSKERSADIGLLYDPARQREKKFSIAFKSHCLSIDNNQRIRFNYPYLGKADGFVTFLRKQFSAKKYIGIELEVNQKHLTKPKDIYRMRKLLVMAWQCTLK